MIKIFNIEYPITLLLLLLLGIGDIIYALISISKSDKNDEHKIKHALHMLFLGIIITAGMLVLLTKWNSVS